VFLGGYSVIHGDLFGLSISLGTFVAFQRFIQKMIWPMAALGMAINYYQRAVSSSKRLNTVLQAQSDVPNMPDGQFTLSPRSRSLGRIEFRNLSFTFPNGSVQALHRIQAVIDPGEKVALVGRLGAGKSALLSVLPRLYPVQRGQLFLDGIDVNDWDLTELRSHIGYVSQEVFLLSASIADNIGFGLPSSLAPQERVRRIHQAARTACCHEDWLALSKGYETDLVEQGANLSGGQRQRLTLARALARNPELLILDDALSALDVQTEVRILKAIQEQAHSMMTQILSSHRLSALLDADQILVLEKGEVVQRGKHSELLRERSGWYRHFFDEQQTHQDLLSIQKELRHESVSP
jgi:ATP-binding cassette subfamily B multidrug efflux pump